jgi:hypothetical protein
MKVRVELQNCSCEGSFSSSTVIIVIFTNAVRTKLKAFLTKKTGKNKLKELKQ